MSLFRLTWRDKDQRRHTRFGSAQELKPVHAELVRMGRRLVKLQELKPQRQPAGHGGGAFCMCTGCLGATR